MWWIERAREQKNTWWIERDREQKHMVDRKS
jgi:hypothetical protein